MKYSDFFIKLKKYVLEHEIGNIKAEHISYFPDAFTSEDKIEKDFIIDTNRCYHNIDSDILYGDFLVIKIVKKENYEYKCRFLMETLHQDYLTGGWTQVVERIEECIEEVNLASKNDDELKNVAYYDNIKNRLILRLINYDDNSSALQDCIYKKHGDIALVVYILIDDSTDNVLTCKLNKSFYELWNESPDTIFQDAMNNTIKYAPPILFSLRELVNGADGDMPSFMDDEFDAEILDGEVILTLTTIKYLNGAVSLFYPGVAHRISEILRDDYYIVFSSTNEIVIHRATLFPPEVIQTFIEETCLFPSPSHLSCKIYKYIATTDELTVVEI